MAICILAIPTLLSAFSDNRPPRTAAIMILIGGVLLVVALTKKPSGYTFAEVPDVIFRVIGRFLN